MTLESATDVLSRPQSRVIFANLVNDIMIAAAPVAYSTALASVAGRKIWLADEGDVVVTPYRMEPELKKYACEVLAIDPGRVETFSPDQSDLTIPLATAISVPRMLAAMSDIISQTAATSALPFVPDLPTTELFAALGLKVEGYSGPFQADVQRFIYRLNTKSGFREAAAALGLRTVPGYYAESLDELVEKSYDLIAMHGGAFVKFDRSSNGYGHLPLDGGALPRKRLSEKIQSHLAAFTEQPRRFTVEALMPFTHVPSIEMRVTGAGVEALYCCDQRCPNASFSGMVTPPLALPEEIERELVRVGTVFGEYVFRAGYRGIFDVDAGLTTDGLLYVTETNLRRTGGTYIDTLCRRLLGDSYLRSHVWWADSQVSDTPSTFRDGLTALQQSGLHYDKRRQRGVVLTANTVARDGKWRYVILAHDAEEASAIERQLAALLHFRVMGNVVRQC